MSFTSSGIQTVLTRGVLILTGVAIGVIQARWLGVEGVGILALIILIKNFGLRLGNFGLGSSVAFFVARQQISPISARKLIWRMALVTSSLSMLVILGIRDLAFSPWKNIPRLLFYLSLISVPLIFYNEFMRRLLSGRLRITDMNFSMLITNAVNLAMLIALVVLGGLDLLGAVLALLTADLITSAYLCRRLYGAFDPGMSELEAESNVPVLRKMLGYGFWNYLIMLTNFFTEELPLMVLQFFAGDRYAIGIFAKGHDFSRQSRVVALPISQILFPFTAAAEESLAARRTCIVCRNYTLLMAIGVVLIAVLIKPIILFLYGAEFLPAALVFYVIAPGMVLWPLSNFLAVHVAAVGHPRIIALIGFVTMAVIFVTCVAVIPQHLALGAGISLSVAFALQGILRTAIFVRHTGIRYRDVLLPHKSDYVYYKHFLDVLFRRPAGKQRKRD